MKRLGIIFLTGAIIFGVATNQVKAEVNGVVLSPAIEEIDLTEEQQEASFEIEVANTTSETADMRLSTVDFGALDESGGVAFLGRTSQETTAYGLKNWMVLEKEHLSLEPGEREKVKVIIENKESLSPGGHYGAVLVSLARANSNEDSVSVLPAASSLVLLKKAGGEITQLEVQSLQTDGSFLQFPSHLNVRFHNSGNVHVVPRGTVEVLGPGNTVVARGTINQASAYVLPESFRQMSVNLKTNTRWLWPGKYKVVVNWRHEGQSDTQQSVVEFIYLGSVFPLIFLLTCIALICFVVRKTLIRKKVIHTSGKRKRFRRLRRS